MLGNEDWLQEIDQTLEGGEPLGIRPGGCRERHARVVQRDLAAAAAKLFEQLQIPVSRGHIVFRVDLEPQVLDGVRNRLANMFGLQSYPGGRTHHGTTIRRRARTIIIAPRDMCVVVAETVQPAADDRVPARLAVEAAGRLAIAMVADFMARILRSNG